MSERTVELMMELDAAYENFKDGDMGTMQEFLRKHWDGKLEGCYTTRQLVEYDMGYSDEAANESIEAHLEECPACTFNLAEVRRIGAIMEGNSDIPIPSDFIARHRDIYEQGLAKMLAIGEELLAKKTNGSAYQG